METIKGIHHITAIASDPQVNVDFYQQVLGQRLVKTTVNFDDPGTYHLYYGDLTGSPGTIMTFFPWQNIKRGTPGVGEVSASAYTISTSSVGYWIERLTSLRVSVGEPQTRFGETVVPFQDQDGMQLELVATEESPVIQPWEDGPVPGEHNLLGFWGVTIRVAGAERTVRLLTEVLGYTLVGEQGSRIRLKAPGNAPGRYIDLLVMPGMPRGRLGAGSVHHVAFRVPDDKWQAIYQERVGKAGIQVTPVRDRQYFRSIYFREPSGVLFEIATDTPGFALDEPVERLGASLKLPPWYEAQRAAIEAALPPLETRVSQPATEREE